MDKEATVDEESFDRGDKGLSMPDAKDWVFAKGSVIVDSAEVSDYEKIQVRLNSYGKLLPIDQIVEEVAGRHPYKVVGIPDTYSAYNEGWADACDAVLAGIERLRDEHPTMV